MNVKKDLIPALARHIIVPIKMEATTVVVLEMAIN
jgi:hypothetical protein